ncbi:hypothetical protein AB0L10_36070 [Streptomyces flaveolus]|uniref:hypothetical protein n=1 Tax=Streptomyces flaveolus TaxID=67297 RepID=UPI00344AC6DA
MRPERRLHLRRCGVRCTIPDRPDQAHNRQKLVSPGGRLRRLDPLDHRERRAGDTPYDRLAVRYEATVIVAAINEWL